MATAGRGNGRSVVFLLVAVAYAVGAASTTPFSTAANVLTGLPVIVVAALAVARWPFRPVRAAPPELPGDADTASEGTLRGYPYRAWVALFVVVVVFEFVEYAARGSRSAHPTLSSMTDAVDRHEALKAIVFFLWLCLGAAIVWAGARARSPDADARDPSAGPRR